MVGTGMRATAYALGAWFQRLLGWQLSMTAMVSIEQFLHELQLVEKL